MEPGLKRLLEIFERIFWGFLLKFILDVDHKSSKSPLTKFHISEIFGTGFEPVTGFF